MSPGLPLQMVPQITTVLTRKVSLQIHVVRSETNNLHGQFHVIV